jgi:hypothetical protein
LLDLVRVAHGELGRDPPAQARAQQHRSLEQRIEELAQPEDHVFGFVDIGQR